MKNEYFQNDVIDLRILGDIGSVCIYRFPLPTSFKVSYSIDTQGTFMFNFVPNLY